MLDKGLHKKLRNNVKIVNGEVKFNVFKGEGKKAKSSETTMDDQPPTKTNFF